MYVRNTLASCEAYDVYTASMPNSVHKDAIYGHGRESKEYLVHLIFRYQANPETSVAYGHYNFLMPTKGEDASASSDTKDHQNSEAASDRRTPHNAGKHSSFL